MELSQLFVFLSVPIRCFFIESFWVSTYRIMFYRYDVEWPLYVKSRFYLSPCPIPLAICNIIKSMMLQNKNKNKKKYDKRIVLETINNGFLRS